MRAELVTRIGTQRTVIAMTDQIDPRRDNLRWAAVAFLIGFAVHGLDHLRRGMSASPMFIMVGGSVQALFVAVAVVMVLMHRGRASLAAVVVGFGSALVFTYAHLLPTILPGYQDSFISPPHTNVTWFSWFSALAEIGTGIAFGFAGIWAMDNERMSGILFFDGACGMCTRSEELLLRLNLTGDLRTEPLQSPGAAERLGIPPSQLLESVRWLDSSGAVYSGAEAASAAVSSAIGTKIPLLVYRTPGIRFVEDAIYRWVAAHRYRFPGTTPYCQSHPTAC
jgi:predicted DCC family thiol-disulfide oxidoreductase YuxK